VPQHWRSRGADIVTVTNRDYFFQSKDHFLAAKLTGNQGHFILEPLGRNTAPAIATAALALRERHGDNVVLLVMPADHLIKDARGSQNRS